MFESIFSPCSFCHLNYFLKKLELIVPGSIPNSTSIFFDSVESAVHVGAVLLRIFANDYKALNIYDGKIILASNWKKQLYNLTSVKKKLRKGKGVEFWG